MPDILVRPAPDRRIPESRSQFVYHIVTPGETITTLDSDTADRVAADHDPCIMTISSISASEANLLREWAR